VDLDNAASVKHLQAPTITLHSKSNVLRPALKYVLLQSYSPSYREYVSKNTSDLKLVTIRSQVYFFRHIVHYNIMTVTIVTVSLSAPPTIAHIRR